MVSFLVHEGRSVSNLVIESVPRASLRGSGAPTKTRRHFTEASVGREPASPSSTCALPLRLADAYMLLSDSVSADSADGMAIRHGSTCISLIVTKMLCLPWTSLCLLSVCENSFPSGPALLGWSC